jgi:hypothetical protein
MMLEYYDSKKELDGLKPMYDEYKQEIIDLNEKVKQLTECANLDMLKISELELALEEANQKIASQTNELLKIVQTEEEKKPAPTVPTVSVRVEHKLSENTTITLGHDEPLGERSMTTAHEEVYLKVLSSLDNLIELSK